MRTPFPFSFRAQRILSQYVGLTSVLTLALSSVAYGAAPVGPDGVERSPKALAPPRVEKFAVLIGIGSYQEPEFKTLAGPLNDVANLKDVLTKNFDFPDDEQHLRVLTNEQATRRNILASFTELESRARKAHETGAHPIVVFYFAGHGSYVSDTNHDEFRARSDDNRDETLVPYDATRNIGNRTRFDIVDDEIAFHRHELLKYRSDVTFIFDCCHSGTLTRAPGDNQHRFREAVPDLRRYSEQKVDFPTDAGRYTTLSACAAEELAREEPCVPLRGKGPKQNAGAFTYFLVQAMRDASQSTRNGDIWRQVSRGLHASAIEQSPQLEGKFNRVFLGGANQKVTPPVIYRKNGNQILVSRGLSGGAVPGGFLQFYVTNGGKALGSGRILSADGEQCLASANPGVSLPSHGFVKLLTPYFGARPLRVAFPPNDVLAARLKKHYQPPFDNFVRVANAGESTDVAIVRTTWDAAHLPRLDDGKRPPKGPIYYVSTGQGAPPLFNHYVAVGTNGDITTVGEDVLYETLDDFAAQRNVLALNNSSPTASRLRTAVKLQVMRLANQKGNASTEAPTSAKSETDDDSKLDFKIGDDVRFEVTNQSSEKMYATLIWVSCDGGITVLEDMNDRSVLVLQPKSSDGDTALTDRYRINAPTGSEVLRLFVSTQPIDLASLERIPSSRAPLKSDSQASPFDLLIGQALGTRGQAPAMRVSFDNWIDKSIALHIAPN